MGLAKSIKPGTEFGRLTVIGVGEMHTTVRYRQSTSQCRCACGKSVTVLNSNLKSGSTNSCGCLSRELATVRPTSHGQARIGKKTVEYIAWTAMRHRVLNAKHPSWVRYGGRGIIICDRWEKFENFLADMGLKPSPQHSLDRIDNDGPYSPENCRWATRQEQQDNRCVTKKYTFYGLVKTMKEWSQITQTSVSAIRQRVYAGWPLKWAFWAPNGSSLSSLEGRYLQAHLENTGRSV